MKKKTTKILFLIIAMLCSIKLTKAYTFNDKEINSDIQALLNEVSTSWPSGMDESRVQVIIEAAKLIGKGIPYVYGGGHSSCAQGQPSGLDCSAYVSLAFHRGGVSDVGCEWSTANYNASSVFQKINESDLVPGDVGLNNSSQSSNNHIGIYIGKKGGKNIWFHSSKTSIGTGPQVREGNGNFTHFLRYKNWNEVDIKTPIENSVNEGIGGELGGTLEDKYYYFDNITSDNDFSCENLFFYQHENGQKSEKELKKILDGIFMIIKIVTPVLTIALTIIDYMKALFKSDANTTKKVNQKTLKRIVIAILILILPYLLDALFHLFGLYELKNCVIS